MKEERVFDTTAMQNTSSVVKPINTLCLEGPVINVVASNQVLYAYYFGVCIEIFINLKYFNCCTCFLFVADHSILY